MIHDLDCLVFGNIEKGKSFEDIDSGPVIIGMGGAATIVGIGTMHLYDETELSTGIRNSIEAFAFPRRNEGKKKYLFGKLPMADVFIAWAHSIALHGSNQKQADFSWRKNSFRFTAWSSVSPAWFYFSGYGERP